MTLKNEVSMTEFQRLQKEFPKANLLAIYTPIPDEEWERWKDWEKNFELPEFLKPTNKTTQKQLKTEEQKKSTK